MHWKLTDFTESKAERKKLITCGVCPLKVESFSYEGESVTTGWRSCKSSPVWKTLHVDLSLDDWVFFASLHVSIAKLWIESVFLQLEGNLSKVTFLLSEALASGSCKGRIFWLFWQAFVNSSLCILLMFRICEISADGLFASSDAIDFLAVSNSDVICAKYDKACFIVIWGCICMVSVTHETPFTPSFSFSMLCIIAEFSFSGAWRLSSDKFKFPLVSMASCVCCIIFEVPFVLGTQLGRKTGGGGSMTESLISFCEGFLQVNAQMWRSRLTPLVSLALPWNRLVHSSGVSFSA